MPMINEPEFVTHNAPEVEETEEIVPEVEQAEVQTSPLMPVNELLVQQLVHEKTNAQTYLNFAGQCDCKGLTGAAKFFRKQSEDENRHFNLIFDYICDRVGYVPELRAIPAMVFDPNAFLTDMIRDSFMLEIGTTDSLCSIKRTALDTNDFLTDTFLDQLIAEQREEEKTFTDMLNRALMFGDTPVGIMMLDQEMGK
jgi:ferritin